MRGHGDACRRNMENVELHNVARLFLVGELLELENVKSKLPGDEEEEGGRAGEGEGRGLGRR